MIHSIEFNGITDSISGWARRLGQTKQGLTQKIEKWGIEIALSVPKGTHVKKWKEYPTATKIALQESIVGFEQKLDGLADIIHANKEAIGVDNLLSDGERQRIAAIKARKSLTAHLI